MDSNNSQYGYYTYQGSSNLSIDSQNNLQNFQEEQKDEDISNFKYKVDNSTIVARNLKSILFSEEFADVVIISGTAPYQERIFAHRQILAASSDVFQKMLFGPFVEGSKREITIPNIQPKILKCLLQFIYTGFVQIDTDIIVPLIQAADQYSVVGAKEEFGKAAQSFMQKATHTDPKCIAQVLKLLYDSYIVDLPEILRMCLEFIDQHTVEVLESESILSLHKELMILILKRDSLYDGLEEIQLYLACLRWARGFGKLDYNDEKQFDISGINEQQQQDLVEILKYVRLPLIPAEIIIQKIQPSSLIDIHDLYIAMAFQAAPDCFKQDKSDKFRHRNGSEVPWCWSKEFHGPHIILSNNFKTAHGCHYDWEKIVGNVTWRSGIHKFEIQIELNMLASSNTWQIIVGVAQPPVNLQTHLGNTAKEWGMMCLSGQKMNKYQAEDYTSGSRRGDIIGVIVDLNTGRLEFTRNGVSLGIAYENVKGPVSPCISLLKGQKITLINTTKAAGNAPNMLPIAVKQQQSI